MPLYQLKSEIKYHAGQADIIPKRKTVTESF